MEGADGAAAAILLGFHAKALTPGAVLHHTFSSLTIQGMWLNDREVGETGVLAAILAEHKVPVVMVSGDDKVCAEAREWIPGVVTCETKKGTGPQSAELVPLEVGPSPDPREDGAGAPETQRNPVHRRELSGEDAVGLFTEGTRADV
jgi:D-aminopeptidase